MSKTRKPAREVHRTPTLLERLSPTQQDLLCLALLYAITLVLYRGIVFDNGAFQRGGDTANAHSYYHAGQELTRAEGADVLWMPFFFSGMPTFGNVAFVPHNVSYLQTAVVSVLDLLFLRRTWSWLVVHYFLAGVFMFFLMRVMTFSRGLALFGAITFMLSPYLVGLAGEGHGSKLMALSYLPLVFLLTHLLFERRDLLSFGLLAAATGTMLLTNHLQIVYYTFIVIGLYLLFQLVFDLRTDRLLAAKKTLLLAGALLIGMCIASYIYLSVYEYSHYSIRGGGAPGKGGGLSWDYATNWSWHPAELITLLIPSFYGLKADYYWGAIEPWTNTTVYVGILPLALSLLAAAYRRNRATWFFLTLTVLVLFISLGRNFSLLYELLFSVLPFFNKFRAPLMILHLLPFTLAILGAHGLAAFLEFRERAAPADIGRLSRRLTTTAVVLAALFLSAVLLRSVVEDILSGFLFTRPAELEQVRQQGGQRAAQALAQIKHLRFELMWKDAVLFFLIALGSLGTAIAFLRNRIQAATLVGVLLAILTADLFIVSAKYVSPQPGADINQEFLPSETVLFLKQQPGLFRVFPAGQLFMDNTFAYHGLHSIGGYSPAKLKNYQTMLDSCLYASPDPYLPLNMGIVNMLGVRYLIVPGPLRSPRFELAFTDRTKGLYTYRNAEALPRAFFVRSTAVAESEGGVFRILNDTTWNPAQTAVLMKEPPPLSGPDSAARVVLKEYRSGRIVLEATTAAPALLVLSEVYYPAGWTATVDGAPTEIFQTNYVLRSVAVPAGSHEVAFTFQPPMYALGYTLSTAGWAAAAVASLAGLAFHPSIRRRLKDRRPRTGPGAQET